VNDLESAGYTVADIVLAQHQCDYAASSLPVVPAGRSGVRNLISHPTVAAFLTHEKLGSYLWSQTGRELVAVKATLFDKTPERNWRVQWHQDRAIAVKERMDVRGYGPWSSKAGTPHVDAPAEVLSQMISVRVHLDDCGSENGPLLVIPGSHHRGALSDEELAELASSDSFDEVCVPRGAIVLMRPLLVHASRPARTASSRRVLHIELAPVEAISPLQWHTAVPLRRAA
jgi:ectoine hydroxylase-related dioxygenase (phytanoyl-CoA dioxygenase family)